MDDIEDMFKAQGSAEAALAEQEAREQPKKARKVHIGKRKVTPQQQEKLNEQVAAESLIERENYFNEEGEVVKNKDSSNQVSNGVFQNTDAKADMPGQAKVFVKTYGCSHNISDSEYMAGLLQEYGYQLVDSIKEADCCLLNSCTVKNPSQEKFVNLVGTAERQGKPVIVSGCVPQGDRNLKGLEKVSILGVTQIDRVVEVVEEALKGNVVRLLTKKELPILDLPKIRKNALVEIIPLSTGCLGSCTYCKTRHARGKLGSYAPSAIVERARQAIDEGVMEIWLTSEDTGAYGRDIDTNLPDLLKSIVEILPDNCMLRLGMTNPPYILEHLQAMADIMKHPRVYQFLHVPVQSGSNDVLDNMNREYTAEEFNEVADFLKSEMPHMIIATDLICGFPTETDAQHQESCDLVRRHQFTVLNISQFYSRPGTVANKWKQVDTQVKKSRSQEITRIFDSYATNAHFVGTEQLCWVMGFDDRVKKNGDGSLPQLHAHTKTYTKVVLPQTKEAIGDEQPAASLIGKCVRVKITEAQKWHITGYIIDFAPTPERAPANYFTDLEQKRKDALLKQFEQDEQALEQQPGKPAAAKGDADNKLQIHFLGMFILSLGFYFLLRTLYQGLIA